MSTLDFATLQMASIISRLAFTFVFLVTLLRHPGEIYFALWAGALSCSLAGSFLMLGEPSTMPMPTGKGAVVYALYGTSLAVSWGGLRLFYERPVLVPQVVVLALCPGLLYGLLSWFEAPVPWCLNAVFASIAVSTGLCIVEILRTPIQERLWTQYVVLSGFVGYFTVFLLSTAVVHFAGERLAAPESGVYSLLFDQWCGVFIQVGYLAMVGERAHLKLSRLAETDPLTGLANRRGLFSALGRKAAVSKRALAGATLLIDIDHFKAINDTHGHENGDRVLIAFAERLQSVVRTDDIVARWGGEEFLVILDQGDGAAGAAVAERVRDAVTSHPFALDSGAITVTASIGVSVLAAGEPTIDAAIARADAALYAAKSSGRNRAILQLPPQGETDTGTRQLDPHLRLHGALESIHAA